MQLLNVGVFGTSQKELEKRVPIHPDHLAEIDEEIRSHLLFEEDYGRPFGFSNDQIADRTGGVASRSELFERCDVVLLAKPVNDDFAAMRNSTVHWGWPHCVQQSAITQTAIDRKLTLIAWEAMHDWSPNGNWQRHVFYRNNEIAGYAGVLHAMNLTGIDGFYGRPLKAVVISYGSVSQGAIRALRARGVDEITVFSQRGLPLATEKLNGIDYFDFERKADGVAMSMRDRQPRPLAAELAGTDIIVNGILQDTDRPIMFVPDEGVDQLKPGSLIVDVSCDEGMGFSFARPTSFQEPIFDVGSVHYYAVDHTPSYLWNSASWEISAALLPYLPIVMQGPESWINNETIRRAIEIDGGEIRNQKILSFQNREANYPHDLIK